MTTTATTDLRVRLALWTDRVRAARAQQQAFTAAANAYADQPTPYSDPYFGDYRRALARAEQEKADAAGEYADLADGIVADLLDQQAAAEMNATLPHVDIDVPA